MDVPVWQRLSGASRRAGGVPHAAAFAVANTHTDAYPDQDTHVDSYRNQHERADAVCVRAQHQLADGVWWRIHFDCRYREHRFFREHHLPPGLRRRYASAWQLPDRDD
jgi:hypothetical protein